MVGKHLTDKEQGRKCLRGMFSKYRKSIFQFFSIHGIMIDIQHFRQLCQLKDKYAQDSSKAFGPESVSVATERRFLNKSVQDLNDSVLYDDKTVILSTLASLIHMRLTNTCSIPH